MTRKRKASESFALTVQLIKHMMPLIGLSSFFDGMNFLFISTLKTIILWLYIDIHKLSKFKASLQQTDRLCSRRMSICFISDGIK